uniref:Small subunit ribosomal protein S21 n=1 Tax=Tetraselmis sp. GSL018 TaxID=582737 RepID=A0A061R4Y4_9CHLO
MFTPALVSRPLTIRGGSLRCELGRTTASVSLPAVQNNTSSRLSMKSKGTFNVEVVVGENEPADLALRRFRRAVNSAGVIAEAKRRRRFEDHQDILKRKTKELRLKKSKKFIRPPTWEEARGTMEPAPFADLFGEPDDIFSDV